MAANEAGVPPAALGARSPPLEERAGERRPFDVLSSSLMLGSATGVSPALQFRSNDQRPAYSMLVTDLCRRLRSRSANGTRFSCGTSKARIPSKLSDVTQPCPASSPSACSTREGSKPVRLTRSPKNNAPPSANVWSTLFVSGGYSDNLGSADKRSQSGKF